MRLDGANRSAENMLRWCRFLTIQKLLGHKDVSMTMTYTHVLHRGPTGVCSRLISM